ncbi:pyrroline-5-carboxylate reductase 3-like [Macrobrachium rosenbergii]|uniref:pyrroline-5-carboxylate reductase 3-like n=1 Tax=Macrobrachium rosenbergii TaxID=79674 RepID=UPI0034D75DFF
MATLRIGFIGAGNMAQAFAKGLIAAGVAKPQGIVVSSPKVDQHLLDQMAAIGCGTTYNNREAASFSDVVVMAVKPAVIPRVLHDLQPCVTPARPLVTSVALGVTLATMEANLPPESRVMRIMPNTPALVQLGASVFCRGAHATDEDVQTTRRVYLAIEALADGGVRMGLPRPLSLKLAAQTVMGAAKMVLETGKHPGQLKDEVCSPGGCTIQGVAALERGGLRAAFISAVHDATVKSIETSGK